MLHQCAIQSAQRLSGPVDCYKVTELGSDLGVNSFGCTFYVVPSTGKKNCDSSMTTQTATSIACQTSTQRLNSEFDYSSFTAQLDDLNGTLLL